MEEYVVDFRWINGCMFLLLFITRNLRCAPGLRGAGKHWDPDASSLESEIEQLPDSDETYAQVSTLLNV